MRFLLSCSVILAALAGCTGSPPTDQQQGDSASHEAVQDLFLLNLTQDYLPPDWGGHTQSTMTGHILVGVARGVTNVHPVEVFRAVRADFDNQTGDLAELGIRPGSAHNYFGSHGGGKDYLVANMRTAAGGSPQLQGWTEWAVHDGQGWHGEEAPSRWQFREARGLAYAFGRPYVLTKSPQGMELWSLDGSTWTSIPLPDMNPEAGNPAMDGNAERIVLAGNDVAGNQAVWEINAPGASPQKTALEMGSGFMPTGHTFQVVVGQGHAYVAWITFPLSGPNMAHVARRTASGWESVGPGFSGMQSIIIGANATSLFAVMGLDSSGEKELHVFDGKEWRQCGARVPYGEILTSDGHYAYLGYMRPLKGSGLMRLDAASPTCWAAERLL
ncbi:MAG: hypothetical protein LC623_09415 [Halobacteriales archaeon]|nr:hypothetical protein [Halobacteriales archaeon]